MNFKLVLTSPYPVVYGHEANEVYETSLSDVERIRKETGNSALELKRIERTHRCATKSWKDIMISENLVEKAGLKDDGNRFCISIPGRFGNRFGKKRVQAWKNPETGEIENAFIEHYFDEESFLEYWEAEGFPMEIEE